MFLSKKSLSDKQKEKNCSLNIKLRQNKCLSKTLVNTCRKPVSRYKKHLTAMMLDQMINPAVMICLNFKKSLDNMTGKESLYPYTKTS